MTVCEATKMENRERHVVALNSKECDLSIMMVVRDKGR